jgi:hypothetical protein
MKKILISSLILTMPLFVFAKKSNDSKKLECGNKKYCKQMTSCKEAKFYLEECGLKKLDRDKDGIPCEKLCGK